MGGNNVLNYFWATSIHNSIPAKAQVRLGLGRSSAGGSRVAAAAGHLLAHSLLTASWKQGLLGFRGC